MPGTILCVDSDRGLCEIIANVAGDREKPYLFMGRLLKAQGRVEVAEKMFNRAVQIRPDCSDALSELHLIEMRRRKAKGFIGRLFGR